MDNMWLTTDEVADRFKVTRVTVIRWCNKGYVPGAEKRGRDWMIPADSLTKIRVPLGGRPKEEG